MIVRARTCWEYVKFIGSKRYVVIIFTVCYFLIGLSVLFWYVFCKSESHSVASNQGYFLQDCNCVKHHDRTESTLVPSSCSDESTWFGPNQKVVSYSFFHGDSKHQFKDYVAGMYNNVKAVRKFYPGWVIRIHTDIPLNSDYCQIACVDLVFWCDIRKSIIPNLKKASGRAWRFIPLGDRSVDIFISRDLDSSIIEREKEIVTDWEYLSDKAFHTARDKPPWGPRDRPVLAGLWGAKNYILGWNRANHLREKLLKMVLSKRSRHAVNIDELSLWRVLYTPLLSEFLQHDSYLCEKWNGTVPFPKRRMNRFEYVAIRNADSARYRAKPCPLPCRPSYGQNWTFC